MGLWYICRNDARAEARLAQARKQCQRHGHPPPREISTPHFSGIATGHIYPTVATFWQSGGDFIAIAGTLFYRGKSGEEALRLLLEDYEPPFDRWADLLGHFAALVFKRGRLFAFTDWSASFHLYQSEDRSVFSTSFLSTARSLNRLHFNSQAVYEFVFHGTALGDDTVFQEISRLGRAHELELGAAVQLHASKRSLAIVETTESLDELVERLASVLRHAFAVPAAHYANNIQCPLSGGFDSRLVLSLLLDAGVRPSLYVYGSPDDTDVRIAKHIAAREGFEIEAFHKGSFRQVTPDEFPSVVEHNFHEIDGTGVGGGMFDAGGNSEARRNRAKAGSLAVSGGGGEVFRNYFYLADRPFRTRAVIDAFYAGFDPRECSDSFRQEAFLHRMDEKLQVVLGVGGERRSRLEIESAYPLFRCPAAFGREMSLVGRFGPYFVPFLEYAIIREAANIPVKWRTHGVLQSRLMARINPRLAAYPSAYGHSFVEPPGWRHLLSDAISLYRPPWLRRYSYRTQRLLGRKVDPRQGMFSNDYLGRVIDLSFPVMSNFFRTPELADFFHYGSVATLEYLAQHFADRLKL